MALVYGLYRESDSEIRYIGLTTRSMANRWREHLSDARNTSKYPVHKWMAKYNDVTYVVLHDGLTENEAKELEIKEIANHKNLLNLSNGGEGFFGYKHTEEFKARLSRSKKGIARPTIACPVCNRIIDTGNAKRWHFDRCGKPKPAPANKGIPMSAEQKLKVSLAHKGKTISSEQRAILSAKLKGRKFEQLTCPHCKKTGNKPPMIAWHFDKCKLAVKPPSLDNQ